jgi:hypothetical protein
MTPSLDQVTAASNQTTGDGTPLNGPGTPNPNLTNFPAQVVAGDALPPLIRNLVVTVVDNNPPPLPTGARSASVEM